MDRMEIRHPTQDDLVLALKDLVTWRTAPPFVLSTLGLIALTGGNLLYGLFGAGLTSYVHALWARLDAKHNPIPPSGEARSAVGDEREGGPRP